jgi:hypothetical protein
LFGGDALFFILSPPFTLIFALLLTLFLLNLRRLREQFFFGSVINLSPLFPAMRYKVKRLRLGLPRYVKLTDEAEINVYILFAPTVGFVGFINDNLFDVFPVWYNSTKSRTLVFSKVRGHVTILSHHYTVLITGRNFPLQYLNATLALKVLPQKN